MAHPCVCCMTSGAMKQGVPQKVLRARYFCAAHAVWNWALLLALVALLGLSAQAQHHIICMPKTCCADFDS